MKCWKLRKTLNFSLCSSLYNASWRWFTVGGIVSTVSVGAANGVLGTVAYSVADMRSPSILCSPFPIIVVTAAPLT